MKIDKMLLYGLASIYASLEHTDPMFVLKQWDDDCKFAFPNAPKAQTQKQDISDDDVNDVYAIYPTRDEHNHNRSVTKGAKAKEKIRAILEKGDISKDVLIRIVKQEVDANRNEGKWLKDFCAFLNNLPDLQEEKTKPTEETKYRTLW